MARAFGPGDEEFLRLIRDLERRLEALERNPSGQGSFGSRQIGTLPCARVFNNASIGSIAASTWTPLTFNSERFDTDAIHSTASNTSRLTATTAGVYSITGSVEWDADTTGTVRAIAIVHSVSSFIAIQTGPPIVSIQQSIATTWKMAAGEYVELQVIHNATGARSIVASPQAYSPEFAMAWLSR